MENNTFKSVAFGGFAKQDVINYIEEAAREAAAQQERLEQENESLRTQIQDLTAQLEQAQGKVQELNARREELEKALGREPTLGELAESVQMLPEELAMTMDAANDVESIYQIIYQGEGNELRLLDKIPEKENLHDRLLNKIFLEELLRSLNAEERKLLYMRYFREMTQTEVADEFGVSQVQISRMEKKILNRLRAII